MQVKKNLYVLVFSDDVDNAGHSERQVEQIVERVSHWIVVKKFNYEETKSRLMKQDERKTEIGFLI